MSTPDSISPSLLLPTPPRLTVVPRPLSRTAEVRATLRTLPASVVAAAGLVAIVTVAVLSGKLLAVSLAYDVFVDTTELARTFGSISFLSIVVIVGAIALGQRGLRALTVEQRLARQVTAVVLGVGYLHLILWFARVAAAALATSEGQSASALMPNVFWWG